MEAFSQRALGTLYAQQGKTPQADDALKRALHLFQTLEIQEEIEKTKAALR